MIKLFRFFTGCSMLIRAVPSDASAQSCAAGPLTVQILGSGGPAINRERGRHRVILRWIGGQARMLVDMGGGAFLCAGQSRFPETETVVGSEATRSATNLAPLRGVGGNVVASASPPDAK